MITKTEPVLTVTGINKSFANKLILRDVNLKILDIHRDGFLQGQVVSLIGISGSGKSTLFNIISGMLKQDSGSVIKHDNSPVKIGDMGVVYQDYYIYYWRKVKKILKMAASKNPIKVTDDEIKLLAEQFDLINHLDKFPAQLSGGQRQRVAIAEQILNGSDYILFDEPFSGLDPMMVDKTIKLLTAVSLTSELKTLIIVSHDLSNSLAISDTVFILGKEKDKEGSTIKSEIDLIARDLAYHPDIKDDIRFRELLKEVKSLL